MDDDEDFSDEARDDYLSATYGPQYAEEHAEEIAQDVLTSDLHQAILESHRLNYRLALIRLEKAQARLHAGNFDEAVFHAGKALDGYARAVFVDPFRERMVQPFYQAFPHVNVKDKLIIKSVLGLGTATGFLYFGIAATTEKADAIRLIEDLKKFLGAEKSPWKARNQVVHELHDPLDDECRVLVESVADFLIRLAAPLEATLAKNDALRLQVEETIKVSEAWRGG